MKKLKPELGKKYGCYEIISEEVGIIKKKAHFLVRCKCAREQYVRADILKYGQSTKCKFCSNKIKYDKNIELGKIDKKGYSSGHQGTGDLTKTQLLRIKQSCNSRNIEWDSEFMTTENLWKLMIIQNHKCALSGLLIWLSKGKNIPMQTNQKNLDYSGWNASLDRIDSSKGYIDGNVQWVHRNINIMKNSYSQEYFIELCNLVTDKNKK